MTNHLYFQVKQLRTRNAIKLLESIVVFIAALFTTVFLPSLLLRYYYNPEELFAEPALLEFIPAVSFAVAGLYFLYVVIGNLMREKRASILERQMLDLEGGCSCYPDGCQGETITDQELEELEKVVAKAIDDKAKKPKGRGSKAATKSKASKTSSTKSAGRKTTTKRVGRPPRKTAGKRGRKTN